MKIDECACAPNYFRTHATDITVEACEEFFEWVSHFDGDLSDRDDGWRSNSLYEYFDLWVKQKKVTLANTADGYLDTSRSQGFMDIVPYIYIGVIDEILRDPTRLDYVHSDPATGTFLTIPRPLRRVLFVGGKEFEQDIDVVLDWFRPADQDVTSWGYTD